MKTLIGVLLSTSLAAACIASPAMAAPQGPWVLPTSDLSAPGQNASAPEITTAPDGTKTAVWYRDNGSHFIIQAATRLPGGIFGTPVDLSATGEDAFSPQIITATDGTTTAVWERDDGAYDIIQAATRPPGGSFGAPVDLSNREFALLAALLERPGTALSKTQLEGRLYGWGDEVESNAVEVHVHNLRKKLGPDAIRTIRGVGYVIERA